MDEIVPGIIGLGIVVQYYSEEKGEQNSHMHDCAKIAIRTDTKK